MFSIVNNDKDAEFKPRQIPTCMVAYVWAKVLEKIMGLSKSFC